MSQATEQIARQYANGAANKVVWSGIMSNIMVYGAKGDGIQDDTAAIQAAIDACPINGVVYIPAPTVRYLLTQSLVINKSLTLRGEYMHIGDSLGPTTQHLHFMAGVYEGIRVTVAKVKIEGISIFCDDTSINFIAGIHFFNGTTQFDNIVVKDVYVMMNFVYGTGVKFKNAITSTFTNIRTFQGAWGFYGDGVGTSCTFTNCWAISSVTGGYYLNNYYYTSFISTACDSGNNPDYAYHLLSCWGISFHAAGAESMNKSFALLNNCADIAFTGCVAVGMNKGGAADATFCVMQNSTNNVSFISCWDDGPGTKPNVTAQQGASPAIPPVIINCRFRGGSFDGTVTTKAVGNSDNSYMIMGRFVMTDNGNSSSVMTMRGRAVGMLTNRIGVMDVDALNWTGYIDSDGSIVPGVYAALPAADAASRGKMIRMQGASGVADGLYICLKSATDTYSWKPIATG